MRPRATTATSPMPIAAATPNRPIPDPFAASSTLPSTRTTNASGHRSFDHEPPTGRVRRGWRLGRTVGRRAHRLETLHRGRQCDPDLLRDEWIGDRRDDVVLGGHHDADAIVRARSRAALGEVDADREEPTLIEGSRNVVSRLGPQIEKERAKAGSLGSANGDLAIHGPAFEVRRGQRQAAEGPEVEPPEPSQGSFAAIRRVGQGGILVRRFAHAPAAARLSSRIDRA